LRAISPWTFTRISWPACPSPMRSSMRGLPVLRPSKTRRCSSQWRATQMLASSQSVLHQAKACRLVFDRYSGDPSSSRRRSRKALAGRITYDPAGCRTMSGRGRVRTYISTFRKRTERLAPSSADLRPARIFLGRRRASMTSRLRR
jgi:hypothetical protein